MKTPFYMTYPMQNLYQTEMEYEKDMERMKEMYPREVRMLLPRIEERCDELEYEGSRIYDENPDRMMMEREICRLYEEIKNSDWMKEEAQAPENPAQTEARQPQEMALQETELLAEEPVSGGFALHLPDGWMLPEPLPEEPMEAGPQPSQPIRDVQQKGNQPGNYGPQGAGGPAGPNGAGDPFRTGEQFDRPAYGPGGNAPGGPENRPPYGPRADVHAQWRPGRNPPLPCNDWLCGLVGVLFQDEVYRRRCRFRRCHRWW